MMQSRLFVLLFTIAAFAGCKKETHDQKELRLWVEDIDAESTPGWLSAQVTRCRHPPAGAPSKQLARCADVIGPTALRAAVERPHLDCVGLLDALSIARRDTAWRSTSDRAWDECCHAQPMNAACRRLQELRTSTH